MNMAKIQQAKTILDVCINEYFTSEPKKETWQYIRSSFNEISNLLNAADLILHEGIVESED